MTMKFEYLVSTYIVSTGRLIQCETKASQNHTYQEGLYAPLLPWPYIMLSSHSHKTKNTLLEWSTTTIFHLDVGIS